MKTLTAFLLLFLPAASALPVQAQRGATSILVAPKAPQFTEAERHAELGRRRAAVAAKMADKSVLILFSAEPKLYTNDVDYVYRQENNLYYLTGLKQNGATLVMTKDGSNVTETLFIPKRNPMREKWEGKMYSHAEVSQISGLRTIVDASEQPALLDAMKSKGSFAAKSSPVNIAPYESVYMLLPQAAQDANGFREFRVEDAFAKSAAGLKIVNAQPIFAELRHVKSPYELKILQHAVDISNEAHMRAMAAVGRAKWEYEVHAEIEYTLRRRNADNWGYPSIVGCGPNATTLHYVESQSPVKKGDVMLIDAAAEYDHYTADITRSYPVNGKFTKEQGEIYQIVYDAQEAVMKATKPGVTFQQLSTIARNTITDGLFKLGLVTDKANPQQTGIWSFHGLGHWIGMNVHDVGSYAVPLRPGMVYTNEPGVYIREDALDNLPDTPAMKEFKDKIRPVYEKYRNIGVRIEDDILVTEGGYENMSAKLPRSIADIEAFMASAPKQLVLSKRAPTGGMLNQAFQAAAYRR
jgi:Xaa-Pro aminopeptidase